MVAQAIVGLSVPVIIDGRSYAATYSAVNKGIGGWPEMMKSIISWFAVLVLFFLPVMAMGAAFSVTVDHTTIDRDHTFRLAARLQGSSDHFTLNITPLAKDFYVTSIRDGQRAGLWREKRYRLGARRMGLLKIPALSIIFHGQKLVSQPFSVKVLNTDSMIDDVRLWVEDGVDRDHIWLHQQLAWHMTVLSTYPFIGAPDVHLPPFDGFDTRRVDAAVPGERVMNGRRLFTMSWHVLLFPRHTGDLFIARPVVSARLLRMVKTRRFAAGNPNFGAGEKHVYARKAVGSRQRIQVRPLPLAAVKLLVGHLALSSDVPDTHVYAGEPLTWSIHLKWKGVRKHDLPDLYKQIRLDGPFTVIRETPLVSVRKSGGQMSVDALYRIELTPAKRGELRLPAVELYFFNPDRGRIEHASLAPRSLRVLPPRKVSSDEGFDISSVSTRPGRGQGHSTTAWWKVTAIALFVLWLATLVAWFFSSRISTTRHFPHRRHRMRASSLRKALAAHDAAAQFSGVKDVLDMPERITPLGLLEYFPDLRGTETAAWLEALERGRWYGDAVPPRLHGEHIRDMVRIIQTALHAKSGSSSTAPNPADFGRIGA